MTMTLTMTVKTRGHLVLDFAYLAARAVRSTAPLRLATVDGVAVSEPCEEAAPELRSSPKLAT